MKQYVILDVHGGIGKNIAATAVASNVKLKYPDSKLIVVASWPRVFLHHPDVWRVWGNGELRYFYNDYIQNNDFLFLKSEPYHHTDFINQTRHLIDVWSEQSGVPTVVAKPSIHLTSRELNFVRNKYASQKPVLVLQTNGGTNVPYPYSWVRDIPPKAAAKLVNLLAKDFLILHIRRQEQVALDGTTAVTTDDIRELFGLIAVANRRLCMDSFAQHASAALDQKATVLWPVNHVNILGYQNHDNVVSTAAVPKEHQSPMSYIEDYRMEGVLDAYPFADDDIFNLEDVVARVLK